MSDVTAASTPVRSVRVQTSMQLRIVRGGQDGQASFGIRQNLSIGRDADCDIVLSDRAASRMHARLQINDNGALVVIDLGSRNGVFVNGRPVGDEGALLERVPAVVRLGESVLCLTRHQTDQESTHASSLLVGGTSLANVRRQLSLIAPTDLPVLLQGETGTGKEVAARLLHQSSRQTGPFVPVNCAALPGQLIESELFGHVKGAFTGATQAKKGLFSLATGGTLFLDEVGELPIDLQPKLLRVLQEQQVRPVGSEREHKVDVRIVSATHRSLTEPDRFRPDLLARLAGVEVQLPPLRERVEDIPMLATFLLGRAGSPRSNLGTAELDSNALEALMVYRWPLNIRELDNALRYASLRVFQRTEPVIQLEDLPENIQANLRRERTRFQPSPSVTSVACSRQDMSHETPVETISTPAIVMTLPASDRAQAGNTTLPSPPIDASVLEDALRHTRGNVKKTAQNLGLSRAHTYRLLTQHGVDPKVFRRPLKRRESVSSNNGTGVA